MPEKRLIFVAGGTGRQGGAVAKRLIEQGWQVRTITRNPSSQSAQKLRDLGVEVVQCDLSDLTALTDAVKGAYGVFGVTEFWEHGYKTETEHGINLVEAARTNGVEHFVFSSVGGIDRTRGMRIRHFDSKYKIEESLKKSGMKWSILRPVTFYENFVSPRYKKSIASGRFRFVIKREIPFQMLAMQDLGVFAEQAFSGDPFYALQAVELASQRLTMDDFAAVLGKSLNRTVEYRPMRKSLVWLMAVMVEITRTGGHYKTGWALLRMFDWMNASPTGGWNADLPRLSKQHPDLMSVEDWVDSVDWCPIS